MSDLLFDLITKADGNPPEAFVPPESAGEWVDLQPSFGWNVPRSGVHDGVGMALAIQCAGVKARDIAKADMQLWRKDGRSWEEVDNHPFAELLALQPNEHQSWGDFWRMIVMHLELAQRAYILPIRDGMDRLVELIPLMPSQVQRLTSADAMFYQISVGSEAQRILLGYTSIVVPESRIISLVGKTLDGLDGLASTALGSPIFSLMGAINRYQSTLFSRNNMQPMVFETDQAFEGDLADAAFRRLKGQLAERVRKMGDFGDPLLLEAGLKAKAVAINSRDAMTTEAYYQQVERVCGLMETPPHKIFHYQNVKYDNQSAANAQYANDCLIPIAKNIETKLRLHLLRGRERVTLYPEFERMALLAGDPSTLMDVIDKAMKSGLLEVNEARDRLPLALSPIEGGDVRYVPVNTATVDRKGNIVMQNATGQPQGLPAPSDQPAPEPAKGPRLAVSN